MRLTRVNIFLFCLAVVLATCLANGIELRCTSGWRVTAGAPAAFAQTPTPTPTEMPTPTPTPTATPTPGATSTTIPADSSVVKGLVYDSATSSQLAGVSVDLAILDSTLILSTLTTDYEPVSGCACNYFLAGAAPGSYKLTFTKSGYYTVSGQIDLYGGQSTTYGDVYLDPESSVTTTIDPYVTTTIPATTTVPGPCPASYALGDSRQDIQTLRQFRDKVLYATPRGRGYILLYYIHAPEFLSILRRNPSIKADAVRVFHALRPAIQASLKDKKAKPDFSPEMLAEIRAFCTAVEEEASPGLKKAMEALFCGPGLSGQSTSMDALLHGEN